LRIIVRRGDSICGGAQVLTRRIRGAGVIGYILRGPLVHPDTIDGQSLIVKAIKEYALGQGSSWLVVVPPYRAFSLAEKLKGEGFAPHPDYLPPTGITQASGVIDLTPDMDAVLQRMNRNTRRNLKRGQEGGVVVRPGTKEDTGLFWGLLEGLCRRRGTTPNIPGQQFVDKVWDVFSPAGAVEMFVAEVRTTPVCALISFRFGQWVFAWRIGWSGEFPDLHPTKVLYLEAIRAAQGAGAKFFDFLQLDPEVADLLAAKKPVDYIPNAGLTLHKLGLGAVVWRVPPTMSLFSGIPLGLASGAAGASLLNSNVARTTVAWARRLLKRNAEAPEGQAD
jgi:lipid II:glycine glycyltransferase (peptidoglycan interpeptide bridge formation enzyme)